MRGRQQYSTTGLGEPEFHQLERRFRTTRPVSRSEEQRLFAALAAGREAGDDEQAARARDVLVQANIRFVIRVAKGYQGCGLSVHELVAEGVYGLLIAVDRFEAERGIKFISYAVHWIRQAILSAIHHTTVVRVPLSVHNDRHAVNKGTEVLSQIIGQLPTVDELSAHTGMSRSRIVSAQRVRHAHVSVDAPLRAVAGGETSPTIEWLVHRDRSVDAVGEDAADPLAAIIAEEVVARTTQALNLLDVRERAIISRYFGLLGDEPMTLDEIGRQMGLTRERIRQLRDKAMDRLRHMAYAGPMRELSAA